MIYDVIIIGAGAAGLFCSSALEWKSGSAAMPSETSANIRPFRGLILEKGRRPGRKLLMSGGGQCNITHTGSIKGFVGCYGSYPETTCVTSLKSQKKRGGLIRSCLYKYNNLSLMKFLEAGGVKTVVREDGKVFPASMKAETVLDMLLRKTAENGFEIKYENTVERIEAVDAPYHWKVHTADESFPARALVIATGGCSYPSTGSDGSMFHILKRDLDIHVTPLKPALSSVQVEDYPYRDLSGISFDPAGVSIWRDGKKLTENVGALLFTHEDLSGPAILNISKYAESEDVLKINYIHPLNYEGALNKLKAAANGAKGSLAGIMASEFRLPLRFCKALTERCGNSLKAPAKQLTGQELRISSAAGFNKAMATSGGVSLSQVDMTTMALREHRGLYVIGEALDVDGITGGYNLQFAYSSGRTAAAAIRTTSHRCGNQE